MAARAKGSRGKGGKGAGGETGTFEKRLARLERIVEDLERGDAPLEKSLVLYEEAVEHLRACHSLLDEAEGKIQALVRSGGGFRMKEFASPPGSDDEAGSFSEAEENESPE